jgi:dCTP deaminase
MIFSDRDLRSLVDGGRLVIEPFDPDSIQPSSIDLRVGHQFRVFANSRYPFIDVKEPMEGLTEMVEASTDEPFILHPGEFVLGATLERVELPDDVVGRLEGKSSLGRLGLLIHSSLPGSEPVLVRHSNGDVRWRPMEEVVRKDEWTDVVSFDPLTFEVGFQEITGRYEGPPDRIFEVVLASGRRVRVTAGHNLFTLDRDGQLSKIRTGELREGTMVAVPGKIPGPHHSAEPRLDLLALAPESERCRLVTSGPSIAALFVERQEEIATLLAAAGIGHVHYYRQLGRLPAAIALQFGEIDRDHLTLAVRGGRHSLPNQIPVTTDLAWLLGLYVAEGYRRDQQVTWANTDQAVLDRVERILRGAGLPVYRSAGAITCSSSLTSLLIGWLEVGDGAHFKRVPPIVFSWPDHLVESFLEGFVDGDGSREPTRISLWTSSTDLVYDFLALLPRLGKRAGASMRKRDGRRLYQVSIPHREHKLLTSVPLPDCLLTSVREQAGLSQVAAARLCGFKHPTDLCNIERRTGRDAVRLATLRRLIAAYQDTPTTPETWLSLTRLIDGHLRWDRVIEVRDTGEIETIFDLEVRPDGRKVENFLAGHGGVFASNTAGYVDPGFKGYLTLELSNVANLPITLYPGMRIGQLSIFQMTSPAENPYGSSALGSKYLGQEGPTPSRYHENFKQTE